MTVICIPSSVPKFEQEKENKVPVSGEHVYRRLGLVINRGKS